jgi:plasmid maintenance system antidote protein VapI
MNYNTDGRKAALSPDARAEARRAKARMALRIEKAFGVSLDTLLRMQAWHDAHAMRQRAGEIKVKRYEPV